MVAPVGAWTEPEGRGAGRCSLRVVDMGSEPETLADRKSIRSARVATPQDVGDWPQRGPTLPPLGDPRAPRAQVSLVSDETKVL